MNPKHNRLWLVRTRSGEILGPFDQAELKDHLDRDLFDPMDEIAPSNAPWMKADVLLTTDEEVTRTSTRNQTVTQTTQTIDTAMAHVRPSLPEPKLVPPTPMSIQTLQSKVAPFIMGSLLILGIWSLIMQSHNVGSRERRIRSENRAGSEFLATIYSLINRGETTIALNILTKHHSDAKPTDYPAYIIPMAAVLITHSQNLGLAKKLLTQVLSEDHPATIKAPVHRWLGFLMLSQGEGDMGENHFLEALQLDPKDAAARFNLGRAYLKQERFIQSLDYLQLAELELPDLWIVHIYKGRARSELGHYQQAEQSFRKAVELDPDRWVSYIYYALFAASRQDTALAQTILRQMILRDPSYEQLSPPPWGFFHEKTNPLEYLSVYTHLMNGASHPERILGRHLIQGLSGGGAESKGVRELASHGNRFAQLVLLREDLASGSLKDLTSTLEVLHGDLRDFGTLAYVTRAQAQASLGRKNDAENDFKFALTLEPSSAIAHWAYAEYLSQNGRKPEAESQIQQILNFHPNYIPALVAATNP
ncbi:MAG: tetratricopeptide repeat protein [Deltaproteobacteria bacterium]|nr:tetratricopeptide repeat protein [Deltaproteobacteria bacterium]MBI3296375.1 tetratricopeptide repeat protein [Deltaproteobacteria bacterium]